jgi:hypothetical protein
MRTAFPQSPRAPGRSRSSARLLLAFACAVWLAAAGCSTSARSSPASILNATGSILTIQLINASTTLPIVGTAVTVQSNNGIECRTAPCPRNIREWKGASDAHGIIRIPRSILQLGANVETSACYGDLIADSAPAADGRWVAELLPREPADAPGPHPLKLLDAGTGAPIADSSVRISFGGGNRRPRTFDSRTNALGYVFVPFEVVAASDPGRVWLEVPGYRRTLADFAWARRKHRLERR